MAQKYGFFNSVNNDRVYDASDVARFLSKFFTNGIFNNSLAVSSNDNMTVSVATGQANINGYGYENTETLTLDIDEADSELNRIDSVIVRLDLTNRQITTMILQGQYATTPSQPSIIRSGNVYDLRLANILVNAGATRITTEDITDTRFGSDCGNVTQAVLELDTSEIFNQYETWFTNWYQNLQDQLDDNQAGHLQNEIDEINNNISEISDDINDIETVVNENYAEQQRQLNDIQPFTLWTNPDPTNSFGAQNITLNSNDYDYLEVYYYAYLGSKTMQSMKIEKGVNFELHTVFSNASNVHWGARTVAYINDTELAIRIAYGVSSNNTGVVASVSDWMVPIKIIGYKSL